MAYGSKQSLDVPKKKKRHSPRNKARKAPRKRSTKRRSVPMPSRHHH